MSRVIWGLVGIKLHHHHGILTHITTHYLSYPPETFHMVNTCDKAVAGWSEDGLTFVVKDPVKFEREIIPQFFKHSKFSSFVRVSTS